MSSIDLVKKKIIISMCAIMLLLITLFGITYAYFTATVNSNSGNDSASITAGSLKLEYDGDNSYVDVTGINPGVTLKSKTFKVKNTGDNIVENYDVILENVVNELEMYEDLTYVLECTSSDANGCTGSEGVFPKGQEVIATNTILPGTIHSYVLTVTYHETNIDQSVDMNKEVSAKVNIKDDVTSIKTLKIYGNSIQGGTPSPTSPIEIESLGDKTKNLFDINNYTITGSPSINIVDGHITGSVDFGNRLTYKITGLDPNKQYTFSFKKTEDSHQFFYVHDSRGSWNGTSKAPTTVTPNADGTLTFVFASGNDNAWSNYDIYDLQLEEGSTATQYESYGYKIPVAIGKNLFNEELLLTNSSVTKVSEGYAVKAYPATYGSASDLVKSLKATLKPNVTYTLSRKLSNHHTSSTGLIAIRNSSGSLVSVIHNNGIKSTTFSLTQEEIDSISTVYIYGDKTNEPTPIFNYIQLEEGSSATDYEKYRKPENIYLNEPLRKVGDYADYIDYENRKVIRLINEKQLTSGLSWKDTYFPTLMTNLNADEYAKDGNSTAVISKYSNYPYIAITNSIGSGIGFFQSDTYWNINSINELNTWLDSHIDMKVYYPLLKKKEERITVPQLSIKNGEPISVCDSKGVCASNIEVEYD